jgi:DNA-binding NtrC family response regulator
MSEPQILIVDDDEPLRSAIRAYLETKGYLVREAGNGQACLCALEANLPDAVVMDYELPDTNATQLLREVHAIDSSLPVIVITGHGTIDLAVRIIKDGAEQFLPKPVEMSVLSKLLEGVLENRRQKRKQLAGQVNRQRYKRDPFLGISAAMSSLEKAVGRLLNCNRSILIEGETGTGKGVLASWMHENGSRANEPFVDMNCAGLNRELLESELFGHEKGAFTGAVTAKLGMMEVAHRGIMFLDEIGDMDPSIQPKLLKVLEEKQIRRVGDVRNRVIDVQLIAATHCNLTTLVAEGKFRSDLYFRINTIQLRIPPLRERVEDIPVLVDWFLNHLKTDLNRDSLNLADGVMQRLQSYSWPGNIRELRNVLERAALLCDGGVIRGSDLSFQSIAAPRVQPGIEPGGDLTIEELERLHIAIVFQRENGKVDQAAGKLGISRSTLYSKIKQYNITLTS